jgi:hypothetical protein
MIRKLMALAGLAVALGACTGPPPPTYSADAFKGIFNQNSASVPANAPATMTPPVGIIFSENVETYLGFIKTTGDYWSSVVPEALKNHVVYADADPTYFAGQVLAMLKARFPSATVIHDFNEAVSTGKKSVVLVDIHAKAMEPYGDRTTKIDIDAYFFNAQMNPVSRLSGHGEHHVPYASADAGVQKSIDAALRELDGKIGALVH